LGVLAVVFLSSAVVAGQISKTTPTNLAALRTLWGDPDFQGVWTGSTLALLELPRDLDGRKFLTNEEAAALEEQAYANRFVERAKNNGDPGDAKEP
jgi:hypothetical protein